MVFRLSDFILESPIYAIYLFCELSKDEYYRICEIIRYYCRKDDVSWIAVYSTTDSKSAETIIFKTGKRGRPKKIIIGKNVAGHSHISVVGSKNKSAYKTAKKIKKALDRKWSIPITRIVSKGNGFDSGIWIDYIYKQADVYRQGGDFDFIKHRIIL